MSGLVAQQQCVGPLQTPLADVAVVALSHQELVGAAMALGEQPIKSLLDPKVAARLAVAEALTNLMFALVTDLRVSPPQLQPCSPRPLGHAYIHHSVTLLALHAHGLPAPLPLPQIPYLSSPLMPSLHHLSGCEVQWELDVGSQAPRGGSSSG